MSWLKRAAFAVGVGLLYVGFLLAWAWLNGESVPNWGQLLAMMIGVHVGLYAMEAGA